MAKELQKALEQEVKTKRYEKADEITRLRIKRWLMYCHYHEKQYTGKYCHERKIISDNIDRLNGHLWQLTHNRRYIHF